MSLFASSENSLDVIILEIGKWGGIEGEGKRECTGKYEKFWSCHGGCFTELSEKKWVDMEKE